MRRLAFVIGVLIVLGGLFLLWWRLSLAPVNPSETKSVSFVVSQGEDIREIANRLHEQGLVKDKIGFFLLIKKLGIEKNIQAGSFQLSPSMEANDIARTLTVGTEDIRVTFKEGWRSEEILDYLAQINPEVWGKIPNTSWKKDEGKLFPDTYFLPKGMPIEEVREHILSTFDQKITPQMREDATKNGFTFDEVLTIASMVEREALHPEDRPIMAGIMYNRLENGMRLDVDATVQYGIGYTSGGGWWKRDLTQQDLQFKSLYNTRLVDGLPPAPISNPGIESIKAAIYPEETDYLFYISDKNGNTHYAETLDQHNANVATYLR